MSIRKFDHFLIDKKNKTDRRVMLVMERESKLILIAHDLVICQEMIDDINSYPNTELISVLGNTLMWRIEHGDSNEKIELKTTVVKHEGLQNVYIQKLDKLGMKLSLKGRKYLLDALVLLNEGTDRKHLFEAITAKYNRSEESVRIAMKRAIQTTWNSAPDDILQQSYTAKLSPGKTVPTVMEFLYYYV